MFSGIGMSTNASTARRRDDAEGTEPASFRYNNPGAQYPSAEAARFGQTGYGIIGSGHKIARFPSPVNGAAANFDLLYRKYTGMTIGAAGKKWTGANGFGVPGYDPNAILTKQMLDDPEQAIALLKAIASRESGHGNNLTEDQWRQAHRMFKVGSADGYLSSTTADAQIYVPLKTATGAGLLRRAQRHIGEEYRNVRVPKDDPNWDGPWDCAEFMSWLVFQEAGILYGCVDNAVAPSQAEAYTGAWKRDAEQRGIRVSVEEAAATVGGILLRYPPAPGKMGHIALCDGKGGTVEAKGERYGVIADTVHGREWHCGILIPDIAYDSAPAMRVSAPTFRYAPDAPNMKEEIVAEIQKALEAKGFSPGLIDGEFGPNTRAAVARFQEAQGLVVDGAVGPETAAALGVSLLGETQPTSEAATLPDDVWTEVRRRIIHEPSSYGIGLPRREAEGIDPLQMLVLAMLSKERSMFPVSDKPGQSINHIGLLLPLLLQSALTGKRLDTTELVSVLLAGKPIAPPISQPPATEHTQSSQSPTADKMTVLLPLLYQRLTGQPWPAVNSTPPNAVADQPRQPAQPATSRPSVQLSAAGLGITTILQALGIVGTPFGTGPEPTQIGTLATLIPIITGVFGATGGFGALLSAGSALFRGLRSAANRQG
ncbi:peptidoglycan-binding domain-containing protein [Microvirga zambiensis]|uniref:peptidoglycan-binding domain-containing protein n=1 Tax=Microvirga zambiensis TaxID=1402137 RepID=UPI00191F506E|nr:peptidoglycan-binding domain-containing protein [Microvirga zambiensis]